MSAGLPQRVVLGLLMRSFPPAHIDELLDSVGRREQRQRLLPARLMVYFTLGLWIFASQSYEQVLAEILLGVPGLTNPSGRETASAAAIGRARQRLGVEPLRLMFEEAANAPDRPGPTGLGGRRLLRLSSVAVDVPDTSANRGEFGRPTSSAPRVRMSLLTDDRTHRVVAVAVGSAADPVPGRRMAGALAPHTLVFMDERPFSPALWAAVRGLGAEQLWPVGDEVELPVHQRLADGSYLSRLPEPGGVQPGGVRVLDCPAAVAAGTVRGGPQTRLVTSITDHTAASAGELAAAFDRHRAHGTGFDAVAAYQSGDRLVLRSKSPELIRQELYAMLCVHHAVGELVDFTLLDGAR